MVGWAPINLATCAAKKNNNLVQIRFSFSNGRFSTVPWEWTPQCNDRRFGFLHRVRGTLKRHEFRLDFRPNELNGWGNLGGLEEVLLQHDVLKISICMYTYIYIYTYVYILKLGLETYLFQFQGVRRS